jgi:hypothetical protein
VIIIDEAHNIRNPKIASYEDYANKIVKKKIKRADADEAPEDRNLVDSDDEKDMKDLEEVEEEIQSEREDEGEGDEETKGDSKTSSSSSQPRP